MDPLPSQNAFCSWRLMLCQCSGPFYGLLPGSKRKIPRPADLEYGFVTLHKRVVVLLAF